MDTLLQDEPIRLRGGVETFDPRLDRVAEFDEESRNYPIRTLLESEQPQTKWWKHTAKLDQGSEGACVGFAWAHELDADPVAIPGMDDAKALEIYFRAQEIDEWAGEDYSGTSVLAGAKVAQEQGYLDEYRWAFGIEDTILTLSHHGPVIFGINWYYDMYFPDANRYVRPTGRLVGGHAILALAYTLNDDIWFLNSWGPDWGWNGLCRMRVADAARLLGEDGEVCVPVLRRDPAEPAPAPEPEPTAWSLGGNIDTRQD